MSIICLSFQANFYPLDFQVDKNIAFVEFGSKHMKIMMFKHAGQVLIWPRQAESPGECECKHKQSY